MDIIYINTVNQFQGKVRLNKLLTYLVTVLLVTHYIVIYVIILKFKIFQMIRLFHPGLKRVFE